MRSIARFRAATLCFLLLLCVQGQLALDLYLPTFPTLSHFFTINDYYAKWSIGVFLLPMALSQLVYGPLSEKKGRKPILISGLSLFVLGSVFCAIAQHYSLFMVGRALQGLGAGATGNQARAIARDQYSGKTLTVVSSYMVCAWGTALIVAPSLGSVILYSSQWQNCFWFLFLVEATLLLAVFFLFDETHPITATKQKTPLANPPFRQALREILSNKQFLLYSCLCSLFFSSLIIFNVEISFIIQVKLGHSHLYYGVIMSLIATGHILGSSINARIISAVQLTRLMRRLLIMAVIVTAMMLGSLLLFGVKVGIIATFMFGYAVIGGAVMSNCLSEAMSSLPNLAGMVSALYGLIVFLGGGLSNFVASLYIGANTVTMTITLLVFSLGMCVLLHTTKPNHPYHSLR